MDRQQAKDVLYTTATIVSNSLSDAQGEIWSAFGDFVEFDRKAAISKINRVEALIRKSLSEIEQTRDTLERG